MWKCLLTGPMGELTDFEYVACLRSLGRPCGDLGVTLKRTDDFQLGVEQCLR